MYTQCPACLTTFRITSAQLKVSEGMVRCGICSAIFHAEQRLLQLPTKEAVVAPSAAATSPKKNKRGRHKNKNPLKHPIRPIQSDDALLSDIPIITERRAVDRKRLAWKTALWSLGNLSLTLLLAGQFIFFYRDELGRIPAWRPGMTQFCQRAGCELLPLQDTGQIELLQTSIAPHPQYENALRIRTTLVNRASFAQTYPLIEVSLTNNAGNVIARRNFSSTQYLETPMTGLLPPNVVAKSVIDVTNPDNKAVGYEIRPMTP